MQTDPGFWASASGNFDLQPGSPLIDAGQVVPGFYDYIGTAPDIGAGETTTATQIPVSESENLYISIFPNPFNKQVNISSASTIQRVKIYNLTGQCIFDRNYNETDLIISLSISGVYLVAVFTGDTILTKKIIGLER